MFKTRRGLMSVSVMFLLALLTACENTENLRKGVHLENTGNYKEAITHYKAFLEEYPETDKRGTVEEAIAEAYFKWSDNEKQLKHWDTGVELMQIVLDEYHETRVAEKVQDTLPEFLLEWSSQLSSGGQFLDALKTLTRLIRYFPASGHAEKGRALRAEIGVFAFSYGEDIYVMNADGSRLKKVASNAISPTISPDGQKIAFIELAKSGQKQGYLTLANIDGRKATRLLQQPTASEPVFSPDGTNILISRDNAFQQVDLSGRTINAYFGIRDFDTIGSYNPTGKQVVAFLKKPQKNISRLCITENFDEYFELYTTEKNPIRGAAWSKDDRRIVFATPKGLHSISPEGGEVTDLLLSEDHDKLDIRAVDISPNGANIVFIGKKASDPHYKLYYMTLAREVAELPLQLPEGVDELYPTGDSISWSYGFLRY